MKPAETNGAAVDQKNGSGVSTDDGTTNIRGEGAEGGASTNKSFFSEQYSTSDGGMETDIYCPGCGEQISGSYLPVFRCPHCEIMIWRDHRGIVTNYEQRHTCPECGHTFGELTDEAPTEFRRFVRNFEQKTEEVFLGIDRIVNRLFN